MDEHSPVLGCLGIIVGLIMVAGFLACVVWVFANWGTAAGIVFLMFGIPIAGTVIYWLVIILLAPILIALGLMSKKEKE